MFSGNRDRTHAVWSSNFLKDHPPLPAGLLSLKPPMPFETRGIGQFRPYAQVVMVKCEDPELIPVRKTSGAAGYDLHSVESKVIAAGGSEIFDTGIAISLPNGYYGKIEGRSSLAIKNDVVPFGGIIDEDYRGNIKVKMFNHGPQHYQVTARDRIAQLIVAKYSAPDFKHTTKLEETDRGEDGFGSTGK